MNGVLCLGTCVCTRRAEDPISTTLKVITLIKAVMCEDRRGEGGGGGRESMPSFMGQRRECVI